MGDLHATAAITLRHLLTHTSGIDGDLFLDTGRGDDCLRRYVEACADLEQTFPVGDSHSYCNSGFVIAGRVVEQLTGRCGTRPCASRSATRSASPTPGHCRRTSCASAPPPATTSTAP